MKHLMDVFKSIPLISIILLFYIYILPYFCKFYKIKGGKKKNKKKKKVGFGV